MSWCCQACGQSVAQRGCLACVAANDGCPVVGIAHDSTPILDQAAQSLTAAGFCPAFWDASSGAKNDAWSSTTLTALVIDVGHTDPAAFQVIDIVRKENGNSSLPIVLISSVYRKTAYKRKPTSLYGANDYVEQHHIADSLAEKVWRLLPDLSRSARPTPPINATLDFQQRIRNTAEAEGLPLSHRVEVLAQAIVADIALYHQAELESLLRGGPAGAMAPVLEQGRKALEEILGDDCLQAMGLGGDPLAEAFAELLSSMRAVGA